MILKPLKIDFLFLITILSLSTIIPLHGKWFFQRTSYGPFKQIEKYKEVQEIFDACDKNTLVTFDVDDTLITARDVMANFDFSLWFGIRAFFKHPGLFLTEKSLEPVLSVIFQQSERYVFDPDIVQIIQQLRLKGCNVVGLTGMYCGHYGVIENMQEWRANMLNNFGINLDNQFTDTTFKNLPKFRKQYPCLHKGILCTNREKKGKVLAAFLDYSKLKPKLIVSFDDQESDLESIAKTCAKKKFTHIGYQMTGGKKACGKWNTDRALLQLDFVVNDKIWLNDAEADAILNGELSDHAY